MKPACLLLSVLLCCASGAFATVWYVDKASPAAPAARNGLSWATAFSDLQPAMEAASTAGGGDVWVAAGIYNEARSRFMHDPSVETGALSLRQWVHVFGGFLPGDTDMARRDYGVNVTVIDGSLAISGTSPALHVIAGANDALLDGFTITGGLSTGNTYQGAGMYVDGNHNLSIANCRIESNTTGGDGGGVMLVSAQNTAFVNCTFQGNRSFNGAGVLVAEGAGNQFFHCIFDGNQCDWDGAALYIDRGQTVLKECTFAMNTATHAGGGVFAVNTGSDTEFSRCRFSANKAQLGGGIFNWTACAHRIVNCVIVNNKATGEGGGGMFNNSNAVPTIMNCSFYGNAAPSGNGGGMASDHLSAPAVTNCIFWGDLSEEIVNLNDSLPVITYSDVQGGIAGEGNVTLDPLYEDPFSDAFSLKTSPLSPCIDSGTAAGAPNTDYDLIPRPQGAAVDMGAYETVQVSLFLAFSGQGTVSPPAGPHYYFAPTTVPVSATALTDWHFDHWDGPVIAPASASTSVNVSGSSAITAVFVHDQATLTLATSGEGSVSPAVGPHLYDTHSVVPLAADAAAGWRFDHWSGPVADPNAAATSATVDANMTVKAVFVRQFTLTIAVEGQGGVDPAAGSHVYDTGAVVPLAATAADGWHFDHWTGPVADFNAASTSTTVDADLTVKAVFVQQFTLAIAVEGEGTVDPAAGSHVYDAGAVVSLTATPAEGWHFDHWTGPVTDTVAASTSATIAADATVTAVFAETSRCGCSGGKSAPFSKDRQGDLVILGAAAMLLPVASRRKPGRG